MIYFQDQHEERFCSLFLQAMDVPGVVLTYKKHIPSLFLGREVLVDIYLPPNLAEANQVSLLLINDGQDLPKFHFDTMLKEMYAENLINPLICVGIHCGKDRRMEYGTVGILDYKGRGIKAGMYKRFVFGELLPFIHQNYYAGNFKEMAYAGFSLGGLSAMDIVWNHPKQFSKVGVFSGSLWWRLKDLEKGYVEETDRIIHKIIREGEYAQGLKFYFTTGSLDEKNDRNNNGIIDSIDDTMELIGELEKKGYNHNDISYVNYDDGRHDVKTWGKAMPEFLKWGWGEGK